MNDFSCAVTVVVEYFWQLFNSNFFTALAGALAGAFGAQVISEKASEQKRLLDEVRCANAAIMVSINVTNTYCMIKAQHVRKLKTNYDQQLTDFEALLRDRKEGRRREEEFHFQADFEELPIVSVPIDVLKGLVFEKMSILRRPLGLMAVLSQTIDALNICIQRRNTIIQELQARSPIPDQELVPLYFGVPTKEGHVDKRYRGAVDGIATLTDDCIFFSHLLGQDIQAYAGLLAVKVRSKALKVEATNFDKAIQDGLLPDSKQYSDWLNMPNADASWH